MEVLDRPIQWINVVGFIFATPYEYNLPTWEAYNGLLYDIYNIELGKRSAQWHAYSRQE